MVEIDEFEKWRSPAEVSRKSHARELLEIKTDCLAAFLGIAQHLGHGAGIPDAEVLIAVIEDRKGAAHPAPSQLLQVIGRAAAARAPNRDIEALRHGDIAGKPVFAALPWNLTQA